LSNSAFRQGPEKSAELTCRSLINSCLLLGREFFK
jgi:hypothetical protein